MVSTVVVAHRGASAYRPEMTRAAYELAIEQGADSVECDVRLTADGHLICAHDARLDRTCDGHGSFASMTLEQLRQVDFGSWKGGKPAQILTLDELLGLLRDAGPAVGLACETKHPNRFGGAVERAVLETLDRFGLGHPKPSQDVAHAPVRIMSFSAAALQRVRAARPTMPLVYLTERRPRIDDVPPFVRAHPEIAIGPGIDQVRAQPQTIPTEREVHVWTVDEDEDFRLCVELGVRAIITNRPDVALRHLASAGGGRQR